MRDAGFALVLITNQSGIARGYFDLATLGGFMTGSVHASGERAQTGGDLLLPARPADGCDCRKPAREWSQKPCAIWASAPIRSWLLATATVTWGRRRQRG